MELRKKRKTILENIGKVIRYNRLKKGITQKELAIFLDVKESTISRYEKGILEIPSSVLFCICDYLEFSLNEFLTNNKKYNTLLNDKRTHKSKSFHPELGVELRSRTEYNVYKLNFFNRDVCLLNEHNKMRKNLKKFKN